MISFWRNDKKNHGGEAPLILYNKTLLIKKKGLFNLVK